MTGKWCCIAPPPPPLIVSKPEFNCRTSVWDAHVSFRCMCVLGRVRARYLRRAVNMHDARMGLERVNDWACQAQVAIWSGARPNVKWCEPNGCYIFVFLLLFFFIGIGMRVLYCVAISVPNCAGNLDNNAQKNKKRKARTSSRNVDANGFVWQKHKNIHGYERTYTILIAPFCTLAAVLVQRLGVCLHLKT